MENNKKVAFYTLGCKVNTYDTDALKEIFRTEGYEITDFNDKADIYIVNTCTVTHFGDKKSRQMLRRAKKLNPEAKIIATGCYAQVSPEKIAEIDEVDLIVGTSNRENIIDIISESTEKINTEEYKTKATFSNTPITESDGHTRAFVKVQDGCRQFCSYCIVPYARGPIRSRDITDTIKEIKTLLKSDYKEVVLTGIHIASYGKENNSSLIDLIKEVSAVDDLDRIRLSSLEPTIVTKEFLDELIKIDKFLPHFHLSLQSGSDSVLKRMNRRYTTEEYLNIVDLIRSYYPNAGITTDIIVGFPGETDEEFEETKEFAKKVKFSKIHIFPYSPREGTPAASFPDQVSSDIKKIRVKELTSIEEESRNNFYNANDTLTEEVLFEKEIEPNTYSGHTKNYIPVITRSNDNLENRIEKVKLHYLDKDRMEAEILEG